MGSPTYDEVLSRFEECLHRNHYPWVETWEIAEVFEASDRTIRNRLNTLAERGEIDARQAGGSTKLWFDAEAYSPPASAASPESESQ